MTGKGKDVRCYRGCCVQVALDHQEKLEAIEGEERFPASASCTHQMVDPCSAWISIGKDTEAEG
jgi:hypothetical protein